MFYVGRNLIDDGILIALLFAIDKQEKVIYVKADKK